MSEAAEPDPEAVLREARESDRVVRTINREGYLWDHRPVRGDVLPRGWLRWRENKETPTVVRESDVELVVRNVETVYTIPVERSLWGDG